MRVAWPQVSLVLVAGASLAAYFAAVRGSLADSLPGHGRLALGLAALAFSAWAAAALLRAHGSQAG